MGSKHFLTGNYYYNNNIIKKKIVAKLKRKLSNNSERILHCNHEDQKNKKGTDTTDWSIYLLCREILG